MVSHRLSWRRLLSSNQVVEYIHCWVYLLKLLEWLLIITQEALKDTDCSSIILLLIGILIRDRLLTWYWGLLLLLLLLTDTLNG